LNKKNKVDSFFLFKEIKKMTTQGNNSNIRVYTIPVNGFGRPKSDDELLKGIDGENLTVLHDMDTREITKENKENWNESHNERFLQLYGPFVPAVDTYRFYMWLRETVGEDLANNYRDKMREYKTKKNKYSKSRRVSFHQVVKRGVPLSEGGEYENEELKEFVVPTEKSRMAEDVLFVFMFVVNEWVYSRHVKTHVNILNVMTVAEGKCGRFGSVIRPTKKHMIDFCSILISKLNLGKKITLNSKAGRIMVNCVQDDDLCDIEDIKSLQLYLSN